MTKTPIPLALLTVAMASCSSDERIVDVATEAADRQAEQNEEMARLNREVAQGTRQLVEADVKAREDFAQLHQDLRVERADLAAERKSIAQERRTESLIVPVAKALGIVLLAIVVIGFCWSLLFGIQKSDDHAELNELLISEITAEQPMLLPPPSQERPSLPSPEETNS